MKLRISSIDNSLPKDDLYQLFAEYGEVDSVKIFRGMNPDTPTCIGFVVMDSNSAADQAVKNLNGFMVGDFKINVEYCHDTVRVKNPTWKPISLDEDVQELSPEVMYESAIDDDPYDDDF